jgi:UDP-2,3-diacylglucosamine hydrolase
MSQRYYFLSDVHLGIGKDRNADRLREKRLVALIRRIEQEARGGEALGLFVVGDLFDSWFEFNSVIPRRHVRTLAALADLAERIPVDYLMGNHDFGHRNFFDSELGIPVHRGDIERVLFGKRFYIAHGDGKAAKDTGYLVLRALLRNPIALALYRAIPPDLGIPFAEKVSGGSRDYTDKRVALQKQDGMRVFAEKMIGEKGFDYVVMGHRHRPEIQEFERGKYVNLGDWLQSYTYGVFDEQGFRIENAPESE